MLVWKLKNQTSKLSNKTVEGVNVISRLMLEKYMKGLNIVLFQHHCEVNTYTSS